MSLTYEQLTKEQKAFLLAKSPPVTSTVRILVNAGIFDKIDMRGLEECWPWLLSTNNSGYGTVRRYTGDPAPIGVHVKIWELFHPDESH